MGEPGSTSCGNGCLAPRKAEVVRSPSAVRLRCIGFAEEPDMTDRVAEVAQQMPTIRSLNGLWRSQPDALGVGAGAIAGDDFDLRMGCQPSGNGFGLAIRQQLDGSVAFEIDDDGAVAAAAAPRPVINADDAWRRGQWAIISGNGSKQRVIANREPETICKTCCWPTTQCQSQMVHQGVQACCPAGHGSDHAITETLGKNVSAAIDGTTDEASDS